MLAPAEARSYVTKLTDAVPSSIRLLGGGSRSRSRRHWTFRYKASRDGAQKVVHLISREDVVDSRLFDTGPEPLPGAATQIVIEAPGDVVLIVRDYVRLLSGIPGSGQIHFSVARIYLQQILQILVKWHNVGAFHGDLRPENVAVRGRVGIQFVDFFARLPVEELKAGSQDYVAPELRDGERRGSTSGDVYSFALLAAELLRPFRGDHRDPAAARLERKFSWLSSYCYVASPEERPTAKAVLDLFFRESDRPGVELAASFVDERSAILHASMPSTSSIQGILNRFGECRLMAPQAIERLRAYLEASKSNSPFEALDGLASQSDGRSIRFADKDQLPSGIDSRWKTNVHRLHFGIGIDRDHAERTRVRPLQPELVLRDKLYDEHLAYSDEIRREILHKNEFLYTDDVVSLLSLKVPGAKPTEVATLRNSGMILAVPDHNRWLYPAFQFTGDGRVNPCVSEVNRVLTHPNGIAEHEWSVLALWSLPQEAFGGVSLKDWLKEPGASVEAQRLLPAHMSQPPYWYHASEEVRTMASVGTALTRETTSALAGDAGETLSWDNSGGDVVLRWSAVTDPRETLDLVTDLVQHRPAGSLGALRMKDGANKVMRSEQVLEEVFADQSTIDLFRLDLGQLALVWERLEGDRERGPVADLTAIFNVSKASAVEMIVRRTGTTTVRDCARVAIEGISLHRTVRA